MREVKHVNAEAERLPYKYCAECGTIYPDSEEYPAPRVCEVNGAGAELAPVYAVFEKGE